MIDDNKQTVHVSLHKVPLKSEREEKRKKIVRIIVTIVLCILFLVIGFVGGMLYRNYLHPTYNADVKNTFGEIEALMDNFWIYSKDHEDILTELENKAFYGMTNFEEDPYTTYMSQEELKEFADGINMDFVGIGVVYTSSNGTAVIQRVIIGSPAEAAGLQAGDIITKIDGVSIDGLSTSEIKERVTGEAGTSVKVTYVRNNNTYDVDVIRGAVDNSVYCYTKDDYIVMELASFGNSTAKECMSYLDSFNNYKDIIIDLRNNTGGYQTSVKEIAGLFIGNGKVYLRQKDAIGNEVEDLTKCSKTYDFDNIVLIVNGETASAAEVFAICLREQLDNVTIVGDTTYGKGVIQSTHYLTNGGVLKFSTYYWYSPNGVSIHKTGIKPDIEVKMNDIYYEYYIEMQDDEKYEFDSVANVTAICQKALQYLDYDVTRNDGYFDENFEKALAQYKIDNNLNEDTVLDKSTYTNIISNVLLHLSNGYKDYQFDKAVELINK